MQCRSAYDSDVGGVVSLEKEIGTNEMNSEDEER